MGTNIVIVAISSVTAIVVAAFTYYTTKQREREAEWRREKLAHYTDYFAALAGTNPALAGGNKGLISLPILCLNCSCGCSANGRRPSAEAYLVAEQKKSCEDCRYDNH